jgi:hypothetical protein
VAALVLVGAGHAVAEPTDGPPATRASGHVSAATYDLGFRIGGYGFRREGDNRPAEDWTECRMNGFGVFASRVMHGPIFVEAGLDLYSSADTPLGPAEGDLPIDRASGLVSVAAGVRTQVTSWLRGYVQLGAGVEITRASVPYEGDPIRATKTMPEGFFGVGLDLRIANKTYVGASFRALAMGNFDYSSEELERNRSNGWTRPMSEDVFAASLDFAAQGQFHLRRDL